MVLREGASEMDQVRIGEYHCYNEDEILSLYRSVGWSNYYESPDLLKNAYAHSLCVLAAYAGGVLAGVIRVVGDGNSIIYIQDILVSPDFQRRGIGAALLGAVLERYQGVYQKVLLTDDREETARFYERAGFRPAGELGCACFMRHTPKAF